MTTRSTRNKNTPLWWLRESRVEKIDEMYHTRNKGNGKDENAFLWGFYKITTWTLLVLFAVLSLVCGKLSVVALSQSILVHDSVSTFLRARGPPSQFSELPGSANETNLILEKSKYKAALENFTSETSSINACGLYHLIKSSEHQAWITYVYSPSYSAYMDKTVIIMWIFLLLFSPFVDLLSGMYSYVRWQSVRRSSLSWKSVLWVSII